MTHLRPYRPKGAVMIFTKWGRSHKVKLDEPITERAADDDLVMVYMTDKDVFEWAEVRELSEPHPEEHETHQARPRLSV